MITRLLRSLPVWLSGFLFVLEKEFEALQARDIEVLEGAQSEKVHLLNQIADGWSLLQDEKNTESSNNNDAHLREITHLLQAKAR